ncbi:TIM-barrel domain-containing protein [Streptococcus acidominimus]|uniref:YSIRK-type signal peptide-containing protein n=1 Tax=Streptococcus acidominimus TaxID=1326 RepID=A0A4Y9FP49_STRAI|nr:TIM-barrel domain-containing protein [Streptococcus acidominimus]MBF0818653.1 discoidin domain-containing protein [Streptococcus acidominimus]MBF0838461.1 discoidin domain-containing protein [Streptococcus acidominimus]MBF0848910.1 discoidin domain-containing protein [Streptococcus danieliae]TFU30941.1 YSIRK-type signal peptide-containing protein [Streptococcus acidominimus]
MKHLFDTHRKYSIRKFAVGTFSVLIGSVMFGINPVSAQTPYENTVLSETILPPASELEEEKQGSEESTVDSPAQNSDLKETAVEHAVDDQDSSRTETILPSVADAGEERQSSEESVMSSPAQNSDLKETAVGHTVDDQDSSRTETILPSISDAGEERQSSEESVASSPAQNSDLKETEAAGTLDAQDRSSSDNESQETNEISERTTSQIGAIRDVVVNSDNQHIFDITYETGHKGQVSFYGDHVVRYHVVPENDEFLEIPTPSRPDRPAEILVKKLADYATNATPTLNTDERSYIVENESVSVFLDKFKSTLKIVDKRTGKTVVEEVAPLELKNASAKQVLKAGDRTQYFGGGTQNGRFTHKGEAIQIVNTNNWVDGGVASPNPFYWTTDGYGVLRHTFKPGIYDFERTDSNKVITTHQDSHFDAFYFVSSTPTNILKDYYELTGKPVVLPIFALYEGHLNAYNRDTWVEVAEGTHGAVYFEEKGKWYKEFQPSQLGNRQGLKETLNGQPTDENYPFTASAVVDRYEKHDMPLGWMLVNDGYGAGYGQTDSLEGNIQNLREFSEYALKKGVKTGLWTQSDLHPKEGLEPLLQRDLPNEVEKGLVRVLKTDVAWVGAGYSFGLNGLTDAAKIMTEKGQNARPFIITLDGWGGTQRYGGIWTGDQTGGQWEYIRFHIPTYIGTGLSGNPNISSDMDGIFGGANKVINIRDFQWKTFTPMQLNMDGWGSNPKTPFAFDTTTSDINRSYLKLKSAMIPYSYSIGHEAADGKPIIRAMFLEFPNEEINYTEQVKYQFMYGENFLIAPVYQNVQGDANGNDVRNGIYLPKDAEWIDYFTGKIYQGGQMLNNFDTPIWKLPIFVKNGAIVPMTKAHNNYTEIDHTLRQVDFYPYGETNFTLVEDDGVSQDYLNDKVAKTRLTSRLDGTTATLTMEKTISAYDHFERNKVSQFNINVSEKPLAVKLLVNDVETALTEVNTLEDFEAGTNVYYYDASPNLNKFSTEGGAYYGQTITKNPVVRVKSARLDVTQNKVQVKVEGFVSNNREARPTEQVGTAAPVLSNTPETNTPTEITLNWTPVEGAKSYDIKVDGIVYTNISGTSYTNTDLPYASEHHYKVRAVLADGLTAWSNEVISRTKDNPLRLAIKGVTVTADHEAQAGTPVSKLVDMDEGSQYHSSWDQSALPETLTLDLNGAYQIDKLLYVPRKDGGTNGMIQEFTLTYSVDGIHWSRLPESVRWDVNGMDKELSLPDGLEARWIRLNISSAVGNFVSGQELYVFKKDNTSKRTVGDVTGDGDIDSNDITSLLNYAGLRRTIDNDFEGYVEVADLNKNDVIDAYDIYYATGQIGDGANKPAQRASGSLTWHTDKTSVQANEEVVLTLIGHNLQNVEAINANLPIDLTKYEVVGDTITVHPDLATMRNFSRVRTHGDRSKEAFVILANEKAAPTISGDREIATIRLRALVDDNPAFVFENPMLVGSDFVPVLADSASEEQSVNQVPAERIHVVGDESVYQPSYGLENLIDGSSDTLTELKWDWEPNYVNGKLPDKVRLPQEMTFTFDDSVPTYLHSMEIVKRTPGNGTVTKYKIEAYNGRDKVYESGEVEVPFAQAIAKHDFDKVRLVDKVILTVLEARTSESTVNNKMMTLKEVRFFEKPDSVTANKVPTADIRVTGNEDVYQAGAGVDKLNDDNLDSLTELKWDYAPNHVNGKLPDHVSLPQEISFAVVRDTPTYLTGLSITKRTPGNGTVTKYKVAVYDGEQKVYESDAVDIPFEQAVENHSFGRVLKADRIVLTVLEARTNPNTINNKMMTLKEVALYELDPELIPYEYKQPQAIPDVSVTEEAIAFDIVYQADDSLERGQEVVAREGIDGRIRKITENGVERTETIAEKVDKLIKVGTKPTVVTTIQPFTKHYLADETKAFGDDVEVMGENGQTTINTTYTVDPQTGQVTEHEATPVVVLPKDWIVVKGVKTKTETVSIESGTEEREDATLPIGEKRIVQVGKPGEKVVTTTYKLNFDTGEVEVIEKEQISRQPIQQIVARGTKKISSEETLPLNPSTPTNKGDLKDETSQADEIIGLLHQDTQLKVIGKRSSFNAAVKLVVTPLNSTASALIGQDYDLYDISLYNEKGEKVQITGEVTVVVPSRDRVRAVYYVLKDMKESLPFVQSEDLKETMFKVTHFSQYALVYEKDPQKSLVQTPNVESKVESLSTLNKEIQTKDTNSPAVTSEKVLPSTGAAESQLALIGLSLAVLGLAGIKARKE